MNRLNATISDDTGTYDLAGDDLESLAEQLPKDWRGTARARDEQGSVRGYFGRDDDGAVTWRYA